MSRQEYRHSRPQANPRREVNPSYCPEDGGEIVEALLDWIQTDMWGFWVRATVTTIGWRDCSHA